jgi:hypothetical protein
MPPIDSIIWEYKLELLADFEATDNSLNEIESALNEMGNEGWELSYLYPKSGKNRAYCVAILKRPKSS